jgi:hypothetical protein
VRDGNEAGKRERKGKVAGGETNLSDGDEVLDDLGTLLEVLLRKDAFRDPSSDLQEHSWSVSAKGKVK